MKIIDGSKRYYKGNLHAHTTVSDGKRTPEALMREYADHGYDFLALTDHRKVGGEQRCGEMLVLPGVEYDFTYETQVLHVVAILPDKAAGDGIDCRAMGHGEVIRLVNERGGVPIAAHPAWSLNTPDFLMSLDGIEISEVYNTLSNEPVNADRGDSSQVLDVVAANGKLFNFVATDDTHFCVGEQCQSYIMLQADELSVEGVIRALKAGRFYASQGPEFKDVEIVGDELIVRTTPVSMCTFSSNVYWVEGRCRTGEGITEQVYKLHPNDKFVRCTVTDAQGRKAWTSPIKVK